MDIRIWTARYFGQYAGHIKLIDWDFELLTVK